MCGSSLSSTETLARSLASNLAYNIIIVRPVQRLFWIEPTDGVSARWVTVRPATLIFDLDSARNSGQSSGLVDGVNEGMSD